MKTENAAIYSPWLNIEHSIPKDYELIMVRYPGETGIKGPYSFTGDFYIKMPANTYWAPYSSLTEKQMP